MNKPKSETKCAGGPKTEEGRKRSARNAVRHGVLSNKMIVLQSESTEEYEELKRDYYDSLQPANFMERELVDEMIWAKWRQRRSITSETAAIDLQMDRDAKKLEQVVPGVDDSTRTAQAIKTLTDESGELALLSRYETRLSRMYHRALDKLLALQDRRRGEAPPAENKQPAPASDAQKQKLPNELQPRPVAVEKVIPTGLPAPSANLPPRESPVSPITVRR
jgi:hypothetical protein